jgi:hypothetical protein
MKKLIIPFSVFLLTALFITPAYSQNKVGQTGLQFLKVDPNARAAGMGGAVNQASYDASAMFYNPAGMSKNEKEFDFLANQTQWIADIDYTSLALAKTFEDVGTFGVSAIITDYGDILGTRVSSTDPRGYTEIGNLNVNAYTIGVAYARNISEQFSIGGQVKYVYQELGHSLLSDNTIKNNSVDGYGFDFGTIFYPGWHSFRFGVSARNFGQELTYEQESFELPLTFTIGVAMDVMDFVDTESQNLLLTVDAVHPRDFGERIHFGLEYTFLSMFALRGGYKVNYDVEDYALGVGFFKDFGEFLVKVDYAYSNMKFFDGINRLTIGFGF